MGCEKKRDQRRAVSNPERIKLRWLRSQAVELAQWHYTRRESAVHAKNEQLFVYPATLAALLSSLGLPGQVYQEVLEGGRRRRRCFSKERTANSLIFFMRRLCRNPQQREIEKQLSS